MDIIVRNLHDQATQQQIETFFAPHLQKLGINFFQCQKLKSRGCATLTIHDRSIAERFLLNHGQFEKGHIHFKMVRSKLYFRDRPVFCSKSTGKSDHFVVEALQSMEREHYRTRDRKPKIVPPKEDPNQPPPRTYTASELKIGQLSYIGSKLTFLAHNTQSRQSHLTFASHTIFVEMMPVNADSPPQQLEIPYDSVQSFVVWPSPPRVTFQLTEAPKIYEDLENSQQKEFRDYLFKAHLYSYKRKRVAAIDKAHEKVVGHCYCYRFSLVSQSDVQAIETLSKQIRIENSMKWSIKSTMNNDFAAHMSLLNTALAEHEAQKAPFEVLFQCQRLAQNGYLPPITVVSLLPYFFHRLRTKASSIVASAIRHMCGNIPIPGPGIDSSEFHVSFLMTLYENSEKHALENDPYTTRLADDYDHIMLVHKAMVTPTTVTLSGPVPEVKNRVLRKYSDFSGFFVSVTFAEENGDFLRFDRNTSSEDIYNVRFKTVLEGNINIAGRGFEFLGFSNSSLREQTCWFMAPFIRDRQSNWARGVIQRLGDFSAIRSPAKCAARIGQAFSQTLSSIAISPGAFVQIDDVQRNGRTFSDGVGKCSQEVLEKIWEGYSDTRLLSLKPTIFQIRYQGAKGVISLDTTLQGEKLHLRPSMIKFRGSPDNNIEICGSARKALPMYLNRQLIKILEDLGVSKGPLLDLQRQAVEALRITTRSPINASKFLEKNHISSAAYLPWLIKKLYYLGMYFNHDPFLRNTLELAVLTQLREIKHKSRIFVENGWTLYGIMDETGFLQENEIYCAVHGDHGLETLNGQVVITRCPAVHPGDVQLVTAVEVPEGSPLTALHNMVVFSQHGPRDLPSKLSGGDLDGDIYNIIWDRRLYPSRIEQPADYENPTPVDIGRNVERADITDFFLTFMQNDNLGMIATLHQIKADQFPDGTLNDECKRLAELHSTAVDFPKSGIPVGRLQIGKYPRARPDFQAPGPHALISSKITLEEVEELASATITDEVSRADSFNNPKILYYESPKILGQLYRDIDELKFLDELHSSAGRPKHDDTNLIDDVWLYVREHTALIQWEHYKDFARGVKDSYEELLTDTILASSSHPRHAISELEVFSGSILGARGAQTKPQRENQRQMKDQFERDVRYITSWIKGGEGDDEDGALERSVACLYVGSQEPRKRPRVGVLKSFAWVAAAVCLKEVERFENNLKFGSSDVIAKSNDGVFLGEGIEQDHEGLPIIREPLVKGKENVLPRVEPPKVEEDHGGVLLRGLQALQLR